jgi:hypothetical protein
MSIRFTRALSLALATVCLFLVFPPQSNAQPTNFAVIGAKLEADPRIYEGPCPTTIKFHGWIDTNGPGTVKYIFERSDGAIDTIVKTVTFVAPPFHQAIPDTTWTLGGPGFTYTGWERIKILSPNAGFLSNQAMFQVKCTGSGGTQPQPGTQPGTTVPGTQPTGTPGTPNGKPDLVVLRFVLKQYQGPCLPQTPVYIFIATVKNQGTAPSPSSASLGNKALVQAMAQDKAGWGNGAFLNALAPGAMQTVEIPVYYLMSDPAFMVGHAPHPFMGIADPLGLVNESDESNNKNGPLSVPAPVGCKPVG